MSTDYGKILNALPRPDLYDSWELVKRHMPVEQPPSTASYIVFQKGGQCYAKNGMTGHIEFGPGDASTVIQSAIDVINASGGGKVFVKSGSYNIKSALVMKSYVALEGELESYLPTVTNGTYFKLASGVKGITAATNAYAFGLKNLSINGQNVSDTGIELLNVGAINVKNVGVAYCNSYGINVSVWDSQFTDVEVEYCNSTGWYVRSTNNVLFLHCTSWGNLYDQWLINGDHGRSAFIQCRAGRFDTNNGLSGFVLDEATRVHLISPMVENMKYHGIRLYGSRYCEIVSPAIYRIGRAATNSYHGIYIHPTTSYNATHNLIVGGMLDNSGVTEQPKYGVYEDNANQDYNYIVGFKVYSAATAKYLLQGAHSKVMLDPFYITQNSGTATFSGNGTTTTFTIAHGLAGTPKSYRVEAGSADAKGDKYVTADATNLTVTFATAPPDGTNNVVLVWSAEM
jgi:hypothetical protein